MTYGAEGVIAEESGGGKRSQNPYRNLYQPHEFIIFCEIAGCRGLALQKCSNRADGVAALEFHGEWMLGQFDAGVPSSL